MSYKYTNDKISYIFEQTLELLLIQIRSLYEEHNENYLDEFELKYRNDFRELLNNILKERNLDHQIEKFLLLEEDPYGLCTKETDIKFIISDIFRDIAVDLSTESMVIKEQWKKEQIGIFTNEIEKLNAAIEKDKQEMISLYENLEIQKKQVEIEKEKSNYLKIEVDNVTKRLNVTKRDLENNIAQSKEERFKYENKLKQSESQKLSLSKEKENLEIEKSKLLNMTKKINEDRTILKEKIKELETSIIKIESTIETHNELYTNKINKLQKENEELKIRNIDSENKLREIIDKEDFNKKKIAEHKNKINKLQKENEELKSQNVDSENKLREIIDKEDFNKKKIAEHKNKINKLQKENEKLKSQNIDSENKLREIIDQKDSNKNEMNKLQKEKEHLKNGVDILKNQNAEKENELRKAINEKQKIVKENKEFTNIISEKDKQIMKLEQKIKQLSKIPAAPKFKIGDIKEEYDRIYDELFTELKMIVAIDSNKTIGGQRVMPIVSDINKDARDLKLINDMSTFKSSLQKLNTKIYQLDNLFTRNNKASGLEIFIQKLNEINDKI